MFNVIVAAKFLTHAKIKYTELLLIVLLFLGLVYAKKIHQSLSCTKKMHRKENRFLFSASRCIPMSYIPLPCPLTRAWPDLDLYTSVRDLSSWPSLTPAAADRCGVESGISVCTRSLRVAMATRSDLVHTLMPLSTPHLSAAAGVKLGQDERSRTEV